MPFGDETSAWWFYGRLEPAVATRFNAQEIKVNETVRLDIFLDKIYLWARPGPETIKGPDDAREIFGLVVGAYALLTGLALDWTLDGWIEALDASLSGSMVGVVVDQRGHDPSLPPDSRRNRAMRRAAGLAVAVRDQPGYRQALLDIHADFGDVVTLSSSLPIGQSRTLFVLCRHAAESFDLPTGVASTATSVPRRTRSAPTTWTI